jgi:hypothetical protein
MNQAARNFALCLLAWTAGCTSYHVNLMGASYHFTRQYHGRNYNEINYGIGGGGMNTVGNNNFGVTATYLKNSFNNDSIYAIGHYTNSWLRLGKFTNSTGLMIGLATGYETRYDSKRNQNPIPVAGLMNDMCLYDFCLFQVVAPSYDGMSGFVAGGARYNFRL